MGKKNDTAGYRWYIIGCMAADADGLGCLHGVCSVMRALPLLVLIALLLIDSVMRGGEEEL